MRQSITSRTHSLTARSGITNAVAPVIALLAALSVLASAAFAQSQPAPVAPASAPTVQAPTPSSKPVAEKLSLRGEALFDLNKSEVKPEGKQVLDRLVDQIRDLNVEVILVVGHTDSAGNSAKNQKLSERRAEAVKAHLISKGIASARVYTEGKAETQPAGDNGTETGRAKNRRAEVEIIGTRIAK